MFNFDVSTVDNHKLEEYLKTTEFPKGWMHLIELLVCTAAFLGIQISELKYHKGILQVKFIPVDDEVYNQIFQLLINGVAKESSLCCLVVDEHNPVPHKGNRRLAEVDCPPYCSQHYILHLNQGEV